MNVNVGRADRIFRVIIGAILMFLAATNTIGMWGWLGLIPLTTGLLRFCPLYALLGKSTCDK